ncbi:PAS domain-containing protein [Georgfuchsia toluolica]|uniref:histidine kinase n=1 Tax=Georgfuchsia toluolica TaxID=424218 RepID=A0A916N1S9_9PROT|nr:ATP-binding protein [Georgfuchsia toluolica]CAG4885250.1 PAS domain-containing protein [Georgfuchsia toluolica]
MEARPLNSTLVALRGDYVPPASFWRSLNYFHLYRFAVASLFVLATIFPDWSLPFGSENIFLARWVSKSYAVLAAVIPLVLLYWKPPFNFLLTTEVFIDIVALTLLMSASGGNHSGLGYLLLVVLAAAGLVGQGRLTLFYAALATVALLLEQGHRALMGAGEPGDFTHTGIISIGFFTTAASAQLLARRVVANEMLARRRGVELATQLEINQRVIRDMLDGVLVVDAEGRVSQYNPRAASLWDCAPAFEARLEDFSADLALRYQEWRRSMTEVTETLRVPRSGRMLRVRFLPAGETDNALLYIEDMERIQAQAQQIKLVALGRLTANMAHEIRNPLAAISHAAELLAEGQETATQSRLTRIINDNTRRLNRMVTDVMELGRRDRAQPELIRLHESIAFLVEDLALMAPRARDIVVLECEAALKLRFDRGHLHRVLTNLIENALRYCSGSPGCVRITATYAATTGMVEVLIGDDGTGIPVEARQHLFEPFFTTRSDGTGLGLYIARELCAANGSDLELRETTGQGTQFRLSGKGEQ